MKAFAVLTATLVVTNEVAVGQGLSHTLLGDQPHDHKDAVVDSVVPNTASLVSFSGAQFQHAVVTAKGWNPDAFFIFTRNFAFGNGKLMEMSHELGEREVRAALVELGYTEQEIAFRILKARMNPL